MELSQGRRLRGPLTGTQAPRPLFASLGHGAAIIDEGYKLITVPGRHAGRADHYLFDLIDDPGERRDLADALSDRRAVMAEKQRRWSALAEKARLVAAGAGEVDPEVLERLRSLGYIR
jgi:arylsulfatase A-like enzyme